MSAENQKAPILEEVQRALRELHGSDYSVVVVVAENEVKIFDEPQPHNHPYGEHALENNLRGARMMWGKERVFLVRADAGEV